LAQRGSTVASKCLLEHMTALKLLSYQFVTASLRLIAEVLGLGLSVPPGMTGMEVHRVPASSRMLKHGVEA
jgi:hypothetical protein